MDDASARPSGPISDLDAEQTRLDGGAEASGPQGALLGPLPGALLGRFVVLGRLGEGGMAVVLQAYDPELDRKVAVKVMRGDVYGERGSIGQARMLREAQAMAKLSHPNVVACYEVGKVPGGVFIAMEMIRGVNLRTWLKAQPRGWREVVRIFLQAGEGLAAAHDAGLVHRDFKPDNVLVGDDGRVRVVDFGLARPEGADRRADAGDPPPTDGRGEATLTAAGSRVGTPAYMAPEQHLGAAADARSDVFAFCVSLYEALYGRRPFAGPDADEVRRSILLREPLPPPAGAAAPRWLYAAVRRGMSREPSDRFPAMRPLLAELSRDRGARARRWGLGVAFTGLTLAWLGATTRDEPAAPSCEATARAQLTGVWDDERRQAVAAAMAGAAAPFAAATWARAEVALDDYAATWVAASQALCADPGADRERRERGELCLERRRGEAQALVDVLAEGSAEAIEHALGAIAQLPPPRECADPEALAVERAPPPPPAEALLAVASLRGRLDRIRAAEWAGRYAAALPESAAIAEEARAIGYAPLTAEALLRRAALLTRGGDYAAAEVALTEAYAAAEAAGADLLRAEALVLRLELVGFLMARPADVAAWIPAAIALVERVRPAGALVGRLWANVGMVDFIAGRFADAEARQRRALALIERGLPADDPERVNALFQLGRTLYKRGALDEALATLEASRALAERALGPEHPALVPIYLNLANVHGGRDEAALIRYYEMSLALGERALGPRHPQVASALSNLGNTLIHRGRVDEAVAHYRRAVDIYLEALGEAHPTTAMNLCNLASGLAEAGALDEARAWFDRAEAVYERAYGGPHPEMALAILGLAETYAAEGRWEEAAAHLRRAVTIGQSGPGDPPWYAFTAMRQEVSALLALGRFGEAEARAVDLVRRADARPPDERASFLFLLAQARAGAGSTAAALADAAAASEALGAGAAEAETRAEIEAWAAALRAGPRRGEAARRPSAPPPAPPPIRAPLANTALPGPSAAGE